MNLLLLTEADRVALDADRFVLTDERHIHLRTVLKVSEGRPLKVGLWDGPKGRATVVLTDSHRTEIDVEWTEPIPARPPVHLVLAIPRPKSLKKLLPEIVTLGVGQLTLLRSWRVAQPYLNSPLLTEEAQRPLIRDGLMQAGCTRPPIVELAPRFQPFIDRFATESPPGIRLVCQPGASSRLALIRPAAAPVTLAIGPEGGWIEYELDAFTEAGFEAVSVGSRILRVETACTAVLANLALLRELSA